MPIYIYIYYASIRPAARVLAPRPTQQTRFPTSPTTAKSDFTLSGDSVPFFHIYNIQRLQHLPRVSPPDFRRSVSWLILCSMALVSARADLGCRQKNCYCDSFGLLG